MPQMTRGSYLGNRDQQQQQLNSQSAAIQAQQAQALAQNLQMNKQRKIDFQGEMLRNDLMMKAGGDLAAYTNTDEGYAAIYNFNRLLGMSDDASHTLAENARSGMMSAEGYEKMAQNYAAGGAYSLTQQQGSPAPGTVSDGGGQVATLPVGGQGSQPQQQGQAFTEPGDYGYTAPKKEIQDVSKDGIDLSTYFNFKKSTPIDNQPWLRGAGNAKSAAAGMSPEEYETDAEKLMKDALGLDRESSKVYDEMYLLMHNTTEDDINLLERYATLIENGNKEGAEQVKNELSNRGVPWTKTVNYPKARASLGGMDPIEFKRQRDMFNERGVQEGAINEAKTEVVKSSPTFKNQIQGVYYDLMAKTGMLKSPVFGGILFGTGDKPQDKQYASVRKALSDAIQGEVNKSVTGEDWTGKGIDGTWNTTKLPEGKETTLDMSAVGKKLVDSGVDLSVLTDEAKQMFGIGSQAEGTVSDTKFRLPPQTAELVGRVKENASPAGETVSDSATGSTYQPVDFTAEQGIGNRSFSMESTVDRSLKEFGDTIPGSAKDSLLKKLEGSATTSQEDALNKYVTNKIAEELPKKVSLVFNRDIASGMGNPSKKLLDNMERNVKAINEGTYQGYLNTLIPVPDAEDIKAELENMKLALQNEGLSLDNAKKTIENSLDIDSYDDLLGGRNLKNKLTNAQIQKLLSETYKLNIDSTELVNKLEESGMREAYDILATPVQPILNAIQEEAGTDGEKATRLLSTRLKEDERFKEDYYNYLNVGANLLETLTGKEARVSDDLTGHAYYRGFLAVLADSFGILEGENQAIPTYQFGPEGSATGQQTQDTGALDLGSLD